MSIKKSVWYAVIIVLSVITVLAGSIIVICNAQELSIQKLKASAANMQILDRNGTLLAGVTDFKAVRTDELPAHTINAFIAVEDKDFFKHSGIAFPSIIRAFFQNIRAGEIKEGASTISQQLIKNTHLNNEKTLRRKIREAALAVKLEKTHSKEEILEMYLNAIYFGNGCTGLGAAAMFYFGKTANGLTVRESAALAGVIRNPSRYNPAKHFKNFSDRANLVLQLMREQNYLTETEYKTAKAEAVEIVRNTEEPVYGAAYKAAAIASAARILNMNTNDMRRNGIVIHTFMEPETQKTIVETASAEDFQIKNIADATADSCIIAATPEGGITGFYESNATLRTARRNFASAMKPFTVYAPALELGVVTPATKILDEVYAAGDFRPKNFDGKYHGSVTVREALEQSYNIPAVKVLEYTGLDRAAEIGRKLGFNLTNNENLSSALGSTSEGTTFFELLGGYCTLANGGRAVRPSLIKKITDKKGKTLWERNPSSMQALGEDTAFLITDMLRTGTKTGTAKKLNTLQFDVASKTGTSERDSETRTNTDAVNCSFTGENVLIVWNGNVDMSPENDLPQGTTGGGITSFIARDIHKHLHKNAEKFFPPDSVEMQGGEYFAKRFLKKTSKAAATAKIKKFKLTGKISDIGAPVLTFETQSSNTYEIMKKDGNSAVLQEVITNRNGEYTFLDRNAKQGKIYEYFVIETTPVSKNTSNTVKLFTLNSINKNSALLKTKQPVRGKNWFF